MKSKEKGDNPINPLSLLDKLDAPENEWRTAIAKTLISVHSKLDKMSGRMGRLEAEKLATLGILTAILLASLKSAFGF